MKVSSIHDVQSRDSLWNVEGYFLSIDCLANLFLL
jgi:hypothetical protein